MIGTLGIDELSWSELFGSQLPSIIHTQATDPRDTDISTEDTIQLMNQYAYTDSSHPIIQSAAEEIRDSYTDNLEQGVFDYVKSHVTFVEDESILSRLFGINNDVELLITPARLLSMRNPMGDCDDFSMLTRSLLLALDIDSSFITVAADREKPRKWSHVYVLSDSDTPIDASHGKYLGWEAQSISREKVWSDPQKEVRRRKKDMIVDERGGSLGDLEGILSLGSLGDQIGDDGNVYSDGGTLLSRIDGGSWGSGSNASSFDFSKILAPLTQAGSRIAIAQFGQPQLAPGTFIRNADGSILTNQPIQNASLFGGGGASSISPTLIIGAVVVLGGLAFLGKK